MTRIDSRAKRTLWVLAAAIFAATLVNMLVPGVLPNFSEQTSISMADIGRTSAAFGLAYAVASPLVAYLLREISPFTVLRTALVLEAVLVFAMVAVNDVWQLYAVRVAQAVTVAGVVPMSTVHAGAIVAPLQRSRALSISFGGMVAASLLGAPLGNYLAGQIGARGTFALAGMLLLVVAALTLIVASHQEELVHAGNATRAGLTYRCIGTTSVIVLGGVFMAAFLEGSATSGLNTFVSPFLTAQVSATGNTLSMLLLCYGVAGLAGNAVMGALADRIGPARVLMVVTGLAGLAVGALPRTTSPAAAAAMLLAWGFCSWAMNPPLQALIISHGGSKLRILVAVNSSIIYTGSSLGAAIASAQVDAGMLTSLPTTAAATFGLSLLASVVAWAADRRGESRTRGA